MYFKSLQPLKACLLDCLDWVPNRIAYIDACLSSDVTHRIVTFIQSELLNLPVLIR